MKLFPVYMHDHSGDSAIEVFDSETKLIGYIRDDMRDVKHFLEEDGYKCVEIEKPTGDWEIYVPNTGIYYEWIVYECVLR